MTIKIDFKNLQIEMKTLGNECELLLKGTISESFDYPQIKVNVTDQARIDLSKIDHCNSYGARQWIFFLRDLVERVKHVGLYNCSIAIMDQFNIAPQMTHKAILHSCYAPYYCHTCDEEVNCLIDRDLHLDMLKKDGIPTIIHSCQTKLEFDALTPHYFKLLLPV